MSIPDRGQLKSGVNDPLIINICIPSLSRIAEMPDAAGIADHLKSAVNQQKKLALYIKALTGSIWR